jgi:flavin reductase (DIM6/NTAB) family NADH-FMN oxidoreductase RutF
MKKIERRIIPVSAASAAQQLYMLGTYNLDGTPFLQTQAFVCYIPGPPEGMIVGVVESDKMKENIIREQAFSLNLCNVDMRFIAESAWRGFAPETSGDEAIGYSNGVKLNVPLLDASPNVIECKVSQSFNVGNTMVFVTETVCNHVDSRHVLPYPKSDDEIYDWYAKQNAKEFNPLLYSLKYFTLSENIGQLDKKDF